jgi:hypothetical protein
MLEKREYEKPVLEYCGKMTEHTKGGSTYPGVGSVQYIEE